jgi:hypothetical protein
MVRFGSALPGARPRDVEWPDVGEERLPGERPAVPGGESLTGVCAGRRRRRSQCRAGAAQRRSTSHQRPCGVWSSPTSLNAGFAGKLTPRRRDDCGVPQQAGRRRARQVTRSAGRERPLGRREKPPSRLERGVAHAPTTVSRCRQAAADSAAAVRGGRDDRRQVHGSRVLALRMRSSQQGGRLLSGGGRLASTRGTIASRPSVPSFVPPPAVNSFPGAGRDRPTAGATIGVDADFPAPSRPMRPLLFWPLCAGTQMSRRCIYSERLPCCTCGATRQCSRSTSRFPSSDSMGSGHRSTSRIRRAAVRELDGLDDPGQRRL